MNPGLFGDEDYAINSSDVVIRSSNLSVGSLLSPNIWLTHNLLVSTRTHRRDVLIPDRKPVHYVLAVQDTNAKGESTIRAVFGAKSDASFLYGQLGNAKLAAQSKRKLTLCDEHGVKLLAGFGPVDDEVLAGDMFQGFLAQAKALSRPYNDELALSRRQRALLDDWLVSGTGPQREQKRSMMNR